MQDLSLKELNKPELFEKFRQQLQRDYEMSGCEAFFPAVIPPNIDDLQEVLSASLSELIKHHSSYNSLLYRIDLSETQIRQALEANPESTLPDAVALLIIKRVLQKIILKQLYSSHDNDH